MAIGWTGPGIPLAPDADAGDGLLDVVLIGDDDRPELLSYLDDRLLGRDPPAPRVPVAGCSQVRLVPDEAGCALRLDDAPWEPAGAGFAARVAAAAVQVLVPGERG